MLETDAVEPQQQLDLGPRRRLQHTVGLHEQALVEHERGVAHERLHEAHPPGALPPGARHRQQPGRELLVGECVVAEHLPGAVVADAEDGALPAAEDRRRQRRLAPSDEHVERVIPDRDHDARQARAALVNDLEVRQSGRGPDAAVDAGHVGDEPRLALEVRDDQPFERYRIGRHLSAPPARASRSRTAQASPSTARRSPAGTARVRAARSACTPPIGRG